MRDWTDIVNVNAEVAILISKLQWPSPVTLEAFQRKLIENPGSCVVMTLEAPRAPSGPRWKIGWLSSRERDDVRKSLQKINARRMKKAEPPTSEPPQCHSNQANPKR
jgi:hypothetical protein